MPQNGRKHAFRIITGQGECIRMTDASSHDFDQHFAGARTFKINFHDFERFAGGNCHRCTCLHDLAPTLVGP